MRNSLETLIEFGMSKGRTPKDIADKVWYVIAPELDDAASWRKSCLIIDPIQVEREMFIEVIEKAEKWDRVKEIVDSVPPCKECSLWETEHPGKYTCSFKVIFDALVEGEGEQG